MGLSVARARNIKPGLYKNEELAECSIWARFIFPGLWMLADREGRLEDRPKRIKGELLPFDSQDAEPLLRELAARGFLIRYENDEGRFIQITRFKKHQFPHYSEKPSAIKPPPLPEYQAIKTPPQPPESLDTESLSSDSLSLLERVWVAFPKQKNKGKAEEVWAAIRPDDELVEKMLSAIAVAKRSDDWLRESGRFIPQLHNWLNAKGWEDEITPPAGVTVDFAAQRAKAEIERTRQMLEQKLGPQLKAMP